MDRPSPQCLVNELDWIFTHVDPNPIFHHSAETIKELYIENHRLRKEKGFKPPERTVPIEIKWAD